jgi:hypothetical protein
MSIIMKQLSLILLALCVLCVPASCKKKAPTSRLEGVFYRIWGGRSLYDQAFVELRKEQDGRLLLTLKGDCRDETLTFEVEDSVFRRCEQLVVETKLYEAKGPYEFLGGRLHDAPTRRFTVTYANHEEDINASGFVPDEIGLGVKAITKYLMSLRGDRQPVGHIFFKKGSRVPPLTGTFTNGGIDFTPEEDGIEELYAYLSKQLGIEYNPSQWTFSWAEGSGFKALVVENAQEWYMDVFLDSTIVDHAILTDGSVQGTYPQGSQRLLTRKDLINYDIDTLGAISEEILARHPKSEEPTDLEHQNLEMISCMKSWKLKHQ